MCLGTGDAGNGTSARHCCSASVGFGMTRSISGGSDVWCARTKLVAAADDCVRFDAEPQQLSACAWLMTRVEAERPESDLCIGQLVPLMQHAMRASGVACHPAHTARLPIESVRTAARAAMCLAKLATHVGCWTAAHVSNPVARAQALVAGKTLKQAPTVLGAVHARTGRCAAARSRRSSSAVRRGP